MDADVAGGPRASRIRWTPLLVILAVGGAAVAFCRLNSLFDNAIRALSTFIASVIIAVLVFGWFLFCTGMPKRRRRILLAFAIAAVGVFIAIFRARYDGDLRITFTPRKWAVSLMRRAGLEVGDVIHQAQLASPPLVIEPTPEDSPQFLGAARDGVTHLSGGRLARDWSQRPPREIWRRKVGPGWSSFAVVGSYAFTQEETTDATFEQVTCYDLTDGQLKWVHGDAGFYDSSFGGKGPRATPTFYAGRLLTVGAKGQFNCFEAATGRRLWSHLLVEEFGAVLPMWGMSSSPLVVNTKTHGDVVVQCVGGPSGNSLMAFRLDDGKVVWHSGDDEPGYASPVLRTLGGVPQIVTVRWQAVTGNDPETGRELWRYNAWETPQPKVPQPIVLDDRRVLISAGYGVGCILLDVTHGTDDSWKVEQAWKTSKLKPKFTNLVVHDGHAYGLDDGEFLMCIDLADGKLKWRSGRNYQFGHGQLLLVDDLLLIQTERGELVLAPADPDKYEELGRVNILPPEGNSWNQPALAGNRLLTRNDVEAVMYELPLEATAAEKVSREKQ